MCPYTVNNLLIHHGRQQYSLPIYTLSMAGSKIYVIDSPEFIGLVQRQPERLAFPPLEAKFSTRVCATSTEANRIMETNLLGDEGEGGLSADGYKTWHHSLRPGPDLDGINRIMVQNVASSLDRLRNGTSTRTIRLKEWIRHELTMASRNSVHGPMNPFKDERVEKAFWYVH